MALDNVNFDEAKQSQLPALELLIKLGFKYISRKDALDLRGGNDTKILLKDVLSRSLMRLNSYDNNGVQQKFSESDIAKVVDELESTRIEGLIDTGRQVFAQIMSKLGGSSITVFQDGRHESKSIRYFDFEDLDNNEFNVTAEYKITGRETIRLDIVCFVNGIPLVVIENKKSSVGYSKAIAQLKRYQSPESVPKLFIFAQLLMAMDSEHSLYGTAGTPEKFYASWREKDIEPKLIDEQIMSVIGKPIQDDIFRQILIDLNGATYNVVQKLDRKVKPQNVSIYGMLRPDRLLDFIKNFVFYDGAIKKVARYQQYFAIKKMLKTISEKQTTDTGIRRKGGIVWHTQGSGKSLTMVMFVRNLIENPNIINPRVIVVTDRIDLDKQIKTTFINAGLLKKKVKQMKSGADLLEHIKNKDTSVLTTLVYKFESASNRKAKTDPDDNIFVLIDEAHRSQAGDANIEMLKVIPNACYIAFTGTPLLKNDKSRNKFGDFIDKYTIDDALDDKIILPLIYEGRYVPMDQDEEQVDRRTERVSEDLSNAQKYQLQKRIENKVIQENPSRIEEICEDIQEHYTKRFQNTGLKGQVVAPSKYAALLMQTYFERRGKINTALILSDENGEIGEEELKKKEVADYLKNVKSNYTSLKSYEETTIDDFINNPDGVELLIVVDKLLTGFDAPCNTVMYLAKQLHDHGLLQAIARVNRLHENPNYPKTCGFIIDYSENAESIHQAMDLFGNYDADDIRSALIDVDQKINELDQKYAQLIDLFNGVESDDHSYIEHLADDPTRRKFKDKFNEFLSIYDECMSLREFINKIDSDDLRRYRNDLKKFANLKKTAELMYGDQVDFKKYEREIGRILDQYVTAGQAEVMTEEIEITDRNKLQEAINDLPDTTSKAEAIAAQMNSRINERKKEDPTLYERFSERIKEILNAMHAKKMADIEALKQLRLLEDEVEHKKDDDLPQSIKEVRGADVIYRNINRVLSISDNELYKKVVIELTEILQESAKVDWWRNYETKRQMRSELDDYLYDKVKKQYGVNLEYDDIESAIEDIMVIAENNHNTFGL